MVAKRSSMSWVFVVGAVLGSACAASSEEGVDAVAYDLTFDEFVASLPVDEETGAFVIEGDILVYASGNQWRRYALSSTRIMKGGNRRIAINTNGRAYAYATP